MTALGVEPYWPLTPTARTRPFERLRLFLLWLVGLSGGFVMFEPAPYEYLMIVTILVFAVSGLPVRAAHIPLVFLLLFYNIGFIIGTAPVIAEEGTALWTAVSCFLAVTTLFFALALTEDCARRFDTLMKGYVLSAIVVCVLGILAYFRLLPSAETFLLYGRVKSTFKDPNVFGPFLVLPGLIVFGRLIFGTARGRLVAAAFLLVIVAGLFLSFSRGAWANFALSLAVFLALSFVTRRSVSDRLRILLFSALALAVLALFVVVLISMPQVAGLFAERSSLVQHYDAGHMGRFGRHVVGALLMLDHPLGIGPYQFTNYLPEDPHNSFLASFAAGGWIAGFTYLALVVTTLAAGLRYVFMASPLQQRLIAVYASFVGTVGQSYIIDVLHWRHYYMVVGILWGVMIAIHADRRAQAQRLGGGRSFVFGTVS